jgi:hypothetical protein
LRSERVPSTRERWDRACLTSQVPKDPVNYLRSHRNATR